jgi:hypothetical protein
MVRRAEEAVALTFPVSRILGKEYYQPVYVGPRRKVWLQAMLSSLSVM